VRYGAPMSCFIAVTLALLAAPPEEPAGLGRLVKGADRAVADKALVEAGVAEPCRGRLAASDLAGLHCRLVVARAVAERPVAVTADVNARAAIAFDALSAGAFVDSWVPRGPEPGLRRKKLDAHKVACDVAFAAIADFEALPPSHAAAAHARTVIAGAPPSPGLRDAACGCARRSTEMAVAADAPADEQALLQGMITRARCNVAGELKTAERRDPSKGFATGAVDVRAAAEASSPEGRLVELARGRSLELERCTDKGLSPEGRIKDAEKLSSCACGIVKRWALPLKKSDPTAQAKLPLAPGVTLPITVESGQITACGPVEARP
jgi:hypothetical protein